jgi:predicted GNAT family acetyltransferase
MTGQVVVRDNPSKNRYEIVVDGEIAGSILYRRRPNRFSLIHTEIDPKFEGHGLGTRLVEGALTDIRAHGLRVVPICPFVQSYLDRHPEFHDLDTRHRTGVD